MMIPPLLISLCLGYIVFLQASKEKKNTRLVGRIIGIVVIILSIAGVLCSAKCMTSKGSCSIMSKMNCDKSTSSSGMKDCPMMLGPTGK